MDSRPWYTPVVKSYKRTARRWERLQKRAARGGGIWVEGSFMSVADCAARRRSALESCRTEMDKIFLDCDTYANKLLCADPFGTIRKFYGTGHHGIPTLKSLSPDGKLEVLASNDSSTL